MNDDYDYRATFDLSQGDLKAIDQALALLEEKFSILDEAAEEDCPEALPFSPRDEVFIHKAIPVLRREGDVFIDDPDVEVDEIRGHMLSIAQLRPRLRRLRGLVGRGEVSVFTLLNEAYDACALGVLMLDRVRPRLTELPSLREAMSCKGPNVMKLLPAEGDTSLLDASELGELTGGKDRGKGGAA